MIHPTIIPLLQWYYPFRNTPAVSLTQDLPQGQDADILLLGCGDAANILFTCFVDNARKIDVTSCDEIPGIQARNVLLYSLLIDDEENQNIDRIWNIYYHWNLDKSSLQLFESQVLKLIEASESIDQWHNSIYGSSIRFCDIESLSRVRSYWIMFSTYKMGRKESEDFASMLKYAIDKAKCYKEILVQSRSFNPDCCRAACPATTDGECASALVEVYKHWWDKGTVPLRNSTVLKHTHHNPAFLYSQKTVTLHHSLSPLLGFPLCTAFTPLVKGSTFSHNHKGNKTTTEILIESAKNHFKLWASAFRRAVKNKSVIRIFSGDALTFCSTLRSCLVSASTFSRSINAYNSNVTSSPLRLHFSAYHNMKNSAPLSFDVIDTSNLCDHLGSLNVVSVASTLLKHLNSSCLYTEMSFKPDALAEDRVSEFFGVDVSTMALLLGLVAPELFTNATNRFEEDFWVYESAKKYRTGLQGLHRLRWRRSQTCGVSSSYVLIDAKILAIFLGKVHDVMFQFETPEKKKSAILKKEANPHYTRASFASILNILRITVKTDWNECVAYLYNIIISSTPAGSLRSNSLQDLFLCMHLYGVDNGRFLKPDPQTKLTKKLKSILPKINVLPDILCVTVRIPREKLKFFTAGEPSDMGICWSAYTTVALVCSLGSVESTNAGFHSFSSVQIVFGTWQEQFLSHPYIKEDYFLLDGSADLYASVLVPTHMLLKIGGSDDPWVACGILQTQMNKEFYFEALGNELCLTRRSIFNEDVHITQFMPGIQGLPNPAISKSEYNLTSMGTTLQMTDDRLKVDKVIQHVIVESAADKASLLSSSSAINIKFETPLKAVITFNQSSYELRFPIPVSPTKCKVRFLSEVSCIEIKAPPFNPLRDDTSSFLFPISLIKTPSDKVLPLPWTSSRINLNAMPVIDLTNLDAIPWLRYHTTLMLSKHDIYMILKANEEGADIKNATTELKIILFNLFMYYTGINIPASNSFGLMIHPDGAKTLIFPSCLRLDLSNHSVVLDCAVVPITNAVKSDPKTKEIFESPLKVLEVDKLFQNQEIFQRNSQKSNPKAKIETKKAEMKDLTSKSTCNPLHFFPISHAANKAWKALLPSMVEQCRAWDHISSCEYILTGKVPRALEEDWSSPICSCGVGKFPQNYLNDMIENWPILSHILEQYATRAAIATIFGVPLVVDNVKRIMMVERIKWNSRGEIVGYGGYGEDGESSSDYEGNIKAKCATCRSTERKNVQDGKRELLNCSRCRRIKYCSSECQKEDWKRHKQYCK